MALARSDFDAVVEVVAEILVTEGPAGLVERVGEEARFEAGGSAERMLGESDALDGEAFLGVDGFVGGD